MIDSRPNSLTSALDIGHPIEAFTVPSGAVVGAGYRLESSFYGSEGYRAARSLFRSGFDLPVVGDHASVFNPPIFTRVHVEDETNGVPYITGSNLLEAKPSKDSFLSKALTNCLTELTIREGMVLISDSGTIGRCVLATREIDGWASTNNLIRVISTDAEAFSQEYFYTYFVSSVGQYLLTRNTYGSVVEHIEPSHVRNTILPWLPLRLRHRITELIKEVSRLRVEANSLLGEADRQIQTQCDLPDKSMLSGTRELPVDSFSVSSDQISDHGGTREHHRLDATYYHPEALSLRRIIRASKRFKTVASASSMVLLLGKTFVDGVHKVDKDHGIPYFTGKELIKTRLLPDVYITSATKGLIERLRVRKDMILVTCAGTVGRIAYVHSNFEGYAVTHDAIRICPDLSVAPGFIYAFLSSYYGQIQLQRCAYGSVIPRLYRTHVENVLLPAPADEGKSIGELVDLGFAKRNDAACRESEAVRLFETAIEDGKPHTEEKWGTEY